MGQRRNETGTHALLIQWEDSDVGAKYPTRPVPEVHEEPHLCVGKGGEIYSQCQHGTNTHHWGPDPEGWRESQGRSRQEGHSRQKEQHVQRRNEEGHSSWEVDSAQRISSDPGASMALETECPTRAQHLLLLGLVPSLLQHLTCAWFNPLAAGLSAQVSPHPSTLSPPCI